MMDEPICRHALPGAQGRRSHCPWSQVSYPPVLLQRISPDAQSLGERRASAPTIVPPEVVVRTGRMGCGSFIVFAPSVVEAVFESMYGFHVYTPLSGQCQAGVAVPGRPRIAQDRRSVAGTCAGMGAGGGGSEGLVFGAVCPRRRGIRQPPGCRTRAPAAASLKIREDTVGQPAPTFLGVLFLRKVS